MVSDNEVMCEVLNDYFGSVFTSETDVNALPEVNNMFDKDSNHMLNSIELTQNIIVSKLRKLKINKAPGVDGIVPRILVENADILSIPLLDIYRESLKSGTVPSDWKRANVTAIFKKGDKSLPSNYRPVSLTSQVCKVLEAIVRDSILEHVEKYKLIKESQHGFLKGRSCLTNLLEFFEFVTNYIDQGYPIDVVYLDFQKAFDKVPHKRLMMKIKALGITGEVFNWIEDWLRDRVQRVVLLGTYSKWTEVRSGVPQGSVLGPLLFLIYINDIDDLVSTNLLKFADDTKVFSVVADKTDIDRLQKDLVNLCKWSKDWLMLFNVDKCKVMHIGLGNGMAKYEMNGKYLEEVTEERDLGVIVQNDLKCSKQCLKAVNTANKVLGMIKRTISVRDREVILQLYKSLVRPHLEYSIQAWRPHFQRDIGLIEGVQRRATKLIACLRDKSYEERLEQLNLTTLETRRLRGDLIEVFKIFKGLDKLDPLKFFELSNAPTRGHSLKLVKPRCRLDVRKFSFAQRVVDVWNSLNDDMVACDSVNGFKKRLDKFLYGRGFT
ncbi:MAG: RNA-directed DNA polymerase [Nitrososphaerota archaeon]